MKNFFIGLAVIFMGGFAGYLVKAAFNVMITGTTTGEEIMTKFVPIAMFFIFLVVGFLIMIGKKKSKNQ